MNKAMDKTNIYFSLLFLDLFCLINFICFNLSSNNVESSIMLGVLFTVIIISYFLGPVVGILSGTAIVFIYGSYTLYQTLVLSAATNLSTYMWMFFILISSLITGLLSQNLHKIQIDNANFMRDFDKLVTIDSQTGLINTKGFYINLEEQLSFSRRHKTPLTLMMVKLHYFDDLKAIVGEPKLIEILVHISSSISLATRSEDIRYKLTENTFAILMPDTKAKTCEIIKTRIKENIINLALPLNEKGKIIKLDIKIGTLELNDDIKDSFEFKALAEKELEYDV